MKIVIINGKGTSGKDEVVKITRNILKFRNHVFNLSSVDKIKESAGILGYNGEKDNKARKFLSDLKKISIEFNDYPNTSIVNEIKEKRRWEKPHENYIVFVHIREIEEIQKFIYQIQKLRIDFSTLLIKRNIEDFGNYSDDNVENFNYDYIINNNGNIDELTKEIKKWLIVNECRDIE
jgi:DNA-binding Lrp family transcriptional regulator